MRRSISTAARLHLGQTLPGTSMDTGYPVSTVYYSKLIFCIILQVNNSHLRTFSASGKTASMTVLGVRLQMEKRFFQTEEIELKCVASFAKTIADFQEQVIIKTFNSENFLLERSSPSSAASSISQASSSKSLICSTLSLLLNFIFFFSNFQPFSCKTTTRRLKCWIAELALIRFKDFSIYSNDTL